MADKLTVDLDSGATADLGDHQRTYGAFIKATQWCTGALIVVLILLALFLL